jgi:RNA polymerase sigma-70 factor (ECF subfamily)
LARIACRCAADASRHGARETSPLLEEPPDPAAGPVAAAVAVERAKALRAALDALPARLREPILLHHVEGLSCREIATALGVGLGTVARRLERARSTLRRRIGGEP